MTLAGGCDDDPDPDPVDGIVVTSQRISAAEGGEIEVPGSAVLSILAGALAEDVTITITTPEGQDEESRIIRFRLEPEGTVFNTPATLTVPYAHIDGAEPMVRAMQISDSNEVLDLGSEQSRMRDLEPVDRDEDANIIQLSLPHFTFLVLFVQVPTYAYVVTHIPPQFLEPGDILFALTSADGKRHWNPGHVGFFAGGSTPCVEGVSDRILESTPDYVQESRLRNFQTDFGHIYMGARIPAGDALTTGERLGIVQFAENVIGADYSYTGDGNVANNKFSCVGLAEAAYDSVERGLINPLNEAFVATPLEMFINTVPRIHITVEAGEEVEVGVRGVVIHPDSPDLGTTMRGWYSDHFPVYGEEAETDIDIQLIGRRPAAAFARQSLGRYIFSWQTHPDDAGSSWFMTFRLTTTPTVLNVWGNATSLGEQTAEGTLSIDVVPCTEETGCSAEEPETSDAVVVAEKLDTTKEEFCARSTARMIEFLIHSSTTVGRSPVAHDHTTMMSYATFMKNYVQSAIDDLFNHSEFNCGEGPNGYTLCPSNNYQASPDYPNDFFQDTDLWYEAAYDPASGWRLNVTDAADVSVISIPSDARIIMYGNVLVLVVPRSELSVTAPDFRITAFRHGGDYGMNAPHDYSGSIWPSVEDGLETFVE